MSIDAFRKTTKKKGFVAGWLSHARDSILADDGWMLLGKSIVIIAGFAGLLVTLITYQATVRLNILQSAKQQFEECRSRLQSGDPSQRANGLSAVPDVISLTAHREPSVSAIESAKILLGLSGSGEKVNLASVQAELLAYMDSYGAKGLSPNESRELISTLTRLGRDGWLAGNAFTSPTSKDPLSWIWRNDGGMPPNATKRLRERFAGIGLSGLLFDRTSLAGAAIQHTTFDNVRFIRANLEGVLAPEAKFTNCIIDTSLADIADFHGSTFSKCDIRGMSARGSNFQGVTFKECILANTDLSTSQSVREQIASRTSLSRARFIDCTVSELNLKNTFLAGVVFASESTKQWPGATTSKLDGADMSSAQLPESTFEDSSFRGTNVSGANAKGASFRFCSFAKAILDNADFSRANLTGASGIEEISSCKGLNIFKVEGLSDAQRMLLKQKGAVEIPSDALTMPSKEFRLQPK